MAENNEYHIYVHMDGATDKKSAVAGSETESVEANSSNGSSDKLVSVAKKLVSYSTVKSTADTLINNQIHQVGLETGATEYEQRLSAGYAIGSRLLNTAVMVGGGIATGNLPLVLVGLFTSGLNTILNISAKQQQINTQQSIENISIGMATVRAGVSGRRSTMQ